MSSYHIFDGPGELPMVRIDNAFAEAEISFYGAQVLRYTPKNARPVLWVSEQSRYEYGKAIRGGIPVCWPWFGAHPTDPAQPAHGFARILAWPLVEALELEDGATEIVFALSPEVWQNQIPMPGCETRLRVRVGAELTVSLELSNRDSKPLTYTGALHSYFAVGDVTKVRVHGLDGCRYRDSLTGQNHIQTGDVTVEGETDRIYFDGGVECLLIDPVWERTIRIAKRGSGSTVVWNPWIAKSKRMADFGDDEYPGMLCIETADAPGDERTLAPGASAELTTVISLA